MSKSKLHEALSFTDYHNKARPLAGFTLIELLIVVALLGILAAVGIPMYNGYIKDSKESVAKNNLRSIYLMEQDYHNENNQYCTNQSSQRCNSTSRINSYLFDGQQILDPSGDYNYYVNSYGSSGYRAYAQPRTSGLSRYYIDHTNTLRNW